MCPSYPVPNPRATARRWPVPHQCAQDSLVRSGQPAALARFHRPPLLRGVFVGGAPGRVPTRLVSGSGKRRAHIGVECEGFPDGPLPGYHNDAKVEAGKIYAPRRSFPEAVNTPWRVTRSRGRAVTATRCASGCLLPFRVSSANGTAFASFGLHPGERGRTTLREILPANGWGDIAWTAPYDTGGTQCSERCYSPGWPWLSQQRSEWPSPRKSLLEYRREARRARISGSP